MKHQLTDLANFAESIGRNRTPVGNVQIWIEAISERIDCCLIYPRHLMNNF